MYSFPGNISGCKNIFAIVDRFIVISSVVRGAGTWKIIVRHEKELKTKTVDQYDFVNFYGYYFIAKGVGWIGRYDAEGIPICKE